MFRGVLVTFPPERRGGKIVPVNIEGVPEKYGRFEIDNSGTAYRTMEHFDHEMIHRYERRYPPNVWHGFDLKYENPAIEKVIFNDPATIVIWKDKTKTVVKCQEGDTYSPELGLAMCIAKKYLGNKGNFNEVFKKWIPETHGDLSSFEIEHIREGVTEFKQKVDAILEPKEVKAVAETEQDIPKVGTLIKIIVTKSGCMGAIDEVGVVTDEVATDGLLDNLPGYNVKTSNGKIWRIHRDSKIEILE